MDEPFDDLIRTTSSGLLPHTGEGIVIDIGTGDGVFVYDSARANPNKFYIGVDANPRPLEKVSEKIHRNPAKGGLQNVLFLQAAIEDLPSELDGVADEVHIHFPWGSLLQVVATGEDSALRSLRRICAPGGILEVVVALEPKRDRYEIDRLALETLSADFIARVLTPRYRAAGFEIFESGVAAKSEWSGLKTSWAKRLRGNEDRTLTYLLACAMEAD